MRQDRDPVSGRHASCQKDSRQTIDPLQQFCIGQFPAAVLDGEGAGAVMCAGSKDRIQISAPRADDVGQHSFPLARASVQRSCARRTPSSMARSASSSAASFAPPIIVTGTPRATTSLARARSGS